MSVFIIYNKAINSLILQTIQVKTKDYPSRNLHFVLFQYLFTYFLVKLHLPFSILQLFQKTSLFMSSKEKEQIQQMEQAEYNFTLGSYLKGLYTKCMRNQLVSEVDLFSLPIKLNMDGQQEHKTTFGGLIHLILVAICIMLACIVIYPDGIALNSQITQTKLIMDEGDNGESIFQTTSQFISFSFYNVDTLQTQAVAAYIQILAYQTFSNGENVNLQLSTDCEYGQFCLKDSPQNHDVSIYGSFYQPQNKKSGLTFQFYWCDLNVVSCVPRAHAIEIFYSNYYKEKNLELTQYKQSFIMTFSNASCNTHNASRQNFISNNKVFGHISNVLSQSLNSYQLANTYLESTSCNTNIAGYDQSIHDMITYVIESSGETFQSTQKFDDIIDPILFFLSVKQTFYFLVFLIFVKQYNRNSGFLKIGSSLFYINNLESKKMYHFDKGYQTFLACFFRNHFIFKAMNFILKKCGKTMYDYLPNKTTCAISLMNKAQLLLQENTFYKKLNDLTLMQNQAPRKIPFVEEQQTTQNEQEQSYDFFSDQNMDEAKKMIYKQAFEQFCQDNGYASSKRKKEIYKVLTNNKLKHILNFEMQRQFKNYLRNVKCQRKDRQLIGQNSFSEENNQIKIQVHDMSNNQLTAGQLIQGRRKDSF